MEDWHAVLKELSDSPDDFERQAGTVMFLRQGHEHIITVTEVAGVGPSVEINDSGESSFIALDVYVQRDILKLPLLARQIIRTLQKLADSRPVPFVEGPAIVESLEKKESWAATGRAMTEYLKLNEPGTTRLIQLMAPAGQGKTVLLENLGKEFASAYQPAQYPTPIILNVDLLGRFVGTIDDAIAGTLNNTFLFPGLTQKDVTLCVRQRWMVLALDGFDELVARVGVRDAFARINELLEQLHASGTVILSAREAFFELYRITAGIRSYLQPRRGSYSTSAVTLMPWSTQQGREVFRLLGSYAPDQDLHALLNAFEGDDQIALQPFFLTRLAKLWTEGERFEEAVHLGNAFARMEYVITKFVEREAMEKWVDRDGNPLAGIEVHMDLLSGVAEEMWRSGATALDPEELRVAAQLALDHSEETRASAEAVLDRLPTHAVFTSRERGYAFLHDRFHYFFLGRRLAMLVRTEKLTDVSNLLSVKELGPDVVEWFIWWLRANAQETLDAVRFFGAVPDRGSDEIRAANISHLCARLLNNAHPDKEVRLANLTFFGEYLAQASYNNVIFEGCRFWHVDLSGSTFVNCRFVKCELADIRVNSETRFETTSFVDSPMERLETSTDTFFAPARVRELLEGMGGAVETTAGTVERHPEGKVLSEAVLGCVEAFVRASERTCDVPIEQLEENYRERARDIAKIAVAKGVMKEVSRAVSGPKKSFVRFTVDREKLLRGQIERTGNSAIDKFWEALRSKRKLRRN